MMLCSKTRRLTLTLTLTLTCMLCSLVSLFSLLTHNRSVVILVPPCRHTDRPGEMCDYGNWRRRGWCRLELAGAVLARTSVNLMLVHGAQTKPEFLFPADALSLSPGLGTFTCKL